MTQAADRIIGFKILPTDDVTAIQADRLELLRMLEAGNGYREIAEDRGENAELIVYKGELSQSTAVIVV